MSGSKFYFKDYPPLGYDNVGQAAVNGQIFSYPRVVRSMADPPIDGQKYCLLSQQILKEPQQMKDGNTAYGFQKVRGFARDFEEAERLARKIVRETDSRFPIGIKEVGSWIPIANVDITSVAKDVVNVDLNEDEKMERVRSEKKDEEKRIMRELKDREEQLKNDGDIYDNPDSLKYYSMRRVTEIRLYEHRDAILKKLREVEKTIDIVQQETKVLENNHPEYMDMWLECYNEERKVSGLPDYVPNSDYENEHNNITLKQEENLIDKGKTPLEND